MKNKEYIIAAGVAVVIGYLYYKNKAKKRNPYPTGVSTPIENPLATMWEQENMIRTGSDYYTNNLSPKADPVTGECPKGYEKVFPMSDMCFPVSNMLK